MGPKRNDLLWKGILEDLFTDFLRLLIPEADQLFDLSRQPEFLDKELEQLYPPDDDLFAPKIVDKLAKVFTRAGNEEWVLCHVEVQGRYHKDFGRRMYEYYARILDKYDKSIVAFAILTERGAVKRSNSYVREYLGTSLRFIYNVVKIADFDTEALKRSGNPFAWVIAVAQTEMVAGKIPDSRTRDSTVLDLRKLVLRELMAKSFPEEKTKALILFLNYYVRFEQEEFNNIFDQELRTILDIKNTMGIAEVLKQQAEASIAQARPQLDKAWKEGFNEGLKKGLNEATIKGLTQGQVQERARTIAILSAGGYSDEEIAGLLEISMVELVKLRDLKH
jgi:hypothetical protein